MTILNRSLSTLGIMAFAVITLTLIVMTSIPTFAHAQVLTRQLEVGSRGADVSAVQTYLAGTPTWYPQGLVTGYFGFLTKSAVSNYQSDNGISAVGRIGPITMVSLNARMAGGGGSTSGDVSGPEISSVHVNTSSNSARVSWNTNEQARGVVYYSSSRLSEYENLNSVTISGATAQTDSNLRSSQDVTLSGLSSNTTYYYDVYVTDASGNVSMTMQNSFTTGN